MREHLHESEHVYACVLRLDRPLVMGATTMLEIGMAVPPPPAGELPAEDETAAFVMRPSLALPPEVCWRGTKPGQALHCRPFLKS